MKTFYTTWVEGTDGGYGREQPTFDEAKQEAERLAVLPGNSGKKVRVLQYLGFVTVKMTVWEAAEQDEVPF